MKEQRGLEELSCWRFQAVDSWFFRETRAHDAVGVSELNSVFPPPTRTLLGAIRTWLGDLEGVNWKTVVESEQHAWLGDAESLGQLSLASMQLRAKDDQGNWQRLWPCPANLMQAKEVPGKSQKALSFVLTRLAPGTVEHTDLGQVALPGPDTANGEAPPGSKVLEGAWLTDAGASDWLAGKTPSPEAIWTLNDLVSSEPRLGIARNNRQATVVKGQLYQTRHLRFVREVSIDLWLKGVPKHLLNIATAATQTLRLGGEGRMAEVKVMTDEPMSLPMPPQNASTQRIALWLTSPLPLALCDTASGLPGFREDTIEKNGKPQDVWVGELNGISLTLTANCRPRAYREGGWDQQKRRPKAVRSYLPPGSVLFCECQGNTPWQHVLDALHGQLLGGEPDWGRGQCLIGLY